MRFSYIYGQPEVRDARLVLVVDEDVSLANKV